MNLPFDYTKALYRKNNYGEPCVWYITKSNITFDVATIFYGILGKNLYINVIKINGDTEFNRKIEDKRKVGYKYLNEIRDDVTLPVREGLIDYLKTYLPEYRDTSDGIILPMLAKVFDNTNNKIFKKGEYVGQYKINGLRCFIRVEKSYDIFKPYRLTFQSREGTIWNSLDNLEDNLLSLIDPKTIEMLYSEHIILDGELYLPGHTVNELNSIIKNVNNPFNKYIQYWLYDLAVPDLIQDERNILRDKLFSTFKLYCFSDKTHLLNKNILVSLPNYYIYDENDALFHRNSFISYGFEGLIMRNKATEYQFGKRVANTMIKYKKATDGIFEIIDIYPEDKRTNIPIIKCKNDINDSTFECHIGGTFEYQNSILINKEKYIGKMLSIEFGERSGVNQVPFHLKLVKLL